ncbi:hypothetical protein SRABI123_01390 [Pseudomonas sp. Bi123]|uniref:hypothetical protein n=1 Tax=Pseudomonas sp. Bi123 TaxID=2821121 RepID=UPI001D587F98|nr:hypothetical protein [Pseudomonas sp. Bi123]CAH0179040.1 hypothetical protein SRABI123_01390 [Pseudomonas sp. Bi123]
MNSDNSRLESSYARVIQLAYDQMTELNELRLNLAETEAGTYIGGSTIRKGPMDRGNVAAHTDPMNDITREELNAKLETIEVRMDARVESVSAKIDGFLAAQAERDKRLDAALSQISANHSETKNSLSSMKTTMVITAVSTVLAIVFGIASFNTALTSNMMAAFQVGLSKSDQPQAKAPAAPTHPENAPPQTETKK